MPCGECITIRHTNGVNSEELAAEERATGTRTTSLEGVKHMPVGTTMTTAGPPRSAPLANGPLIAPALGNVPALPLSNTNGHGSARWMTWASGNCAWSGAGCRRANDPQPRLDRAASSGGEWHVSVESSEMVTIPRAELDSLRAEVRRLRREVGRAVAKARILGDLGPGDDAPTFSRSQLAEAWGITD